MNISNTQQASPLINDILSNGHEFSFIQVMRCIRAFLEKGSGNDLPDVPWQDRVSVKPALSFSFPPADVSSVNRNENGFEVVTNFLGLYGSSSPLPTFYTEDLMDEASRDSSVSREFLDIIHQRLYRLYFDCWSKYRLFIRVAEEKNPLDRERLFCPIGLREKELRDSVPDPRSLLRYAGLLTQYPRSASGLLALLRDALGIAKITIEQCVLRKVAIPGDQRMRLGMTSMSLGMNTVLGSHINDRMGKFRIIVGPLKKKEFDAFLPGGPLHAKLASLARIYITDPLDYDLKLILAAGEAQPIRLGDPNGARLGLSSWCFSGDTLGEVSAVFPVTHNPSMPAPSRDDPPKSGVFTLTDRYREELAQLRKLAAQYAEKHPDMASLVCGRTPDAGIERLFEGVAFLNAHLRMKLDDDFPEVIHEVMEVLDPASLRPVPASTIVAFTPKPNLTEPRIIPAGTELKSIPVEGTECRFTTRYPVEIHPLTLVDATYSKPPGKPAVITLSLNLTGIALSNWRISSLRLFLSGETGSNLYLALMRHVKRIMIEPENGGQAVKLEANHLQPVGFEEKQVLLPDEAPACSGYRQMREYFIQPDKFMFVDVTGWEKWTERGAGTEFVVRFELESLPFTLSRLKRDDFTLFASPAVNVFPHTSAPIVIKDHKSDYQLKPADSQLGHFDIYSVENVAGLLDNTSRKFSLMPDKQRNRQCGSAPVFRIQRKHSCIHNRSDLSISLDTPPKPSPQSITSLIVELTCTNRQLPHKLQHGDLCIGTDKSPVFAEFKDMKPFTESAYHLTSGNNTLWRLYSHHNINISLLNTNSLRAILISVSQIFNNNLTAIDTNAKRIRGIEKVYVKSSDKLMGKSMRRGWELYLTVDEKQYESIGDLYVFGTLLSYLLNDLTTQMCFTHTFIENQQGNILFEYPIMLGNKATL